MSISAQPEPWHCDACQATYLSPLPLRHPPNHRCSPPGRPMRIRKMTPGELPAALEVDA